MIIWNEENKFSLSIDHVYRCYTDISYIERRLKTQQKHYIELVHNKADNEIEMVSNSGPLLKFQTVEEKPNHYIYSKIWPLHKSLKQVGSAEVELKFYETKEGTTVRECIKTGSNPKLRWRILIKFVLLCLKLQINDEKKKFKSWVENHA